MVVVAEEEGIAVMKRSRQCGVVEGTPVRFKDRLFIIYCKIH